MQETKLKILCAGSETPSVNYLCFNICLKLSKLFYLFLFYKTNKSRSFGNGLKNDNYRITIVFEVWANRFNIVVYHKRINTVIDRFDVIFS